MIEFLLTSLSDIKLRLSSSDDENDVLYWRNDPITVSFTPKKNTVSRTVHKKWFKKQLQNEDSPLLIAFTGNKKVGMVRFDLVESSMNNYYEISIHLDPSFRGKNISSQIIDLGIQYLINSQRVIFPIFAKISNENVTSLKSFKKSNFEKYEIKLNDSYIKEQINDGWSYYIYRFTE